jgi:hypothetical protein
MIARGNMAHRMRFERPEGSNVHGARGFIESEMERKPSYEG